VAVSAYLVYPSNNSTKNAILFLTDGLGHECKDSQLLADQFASHGYFVVMPDLFGGDTVRMNTPEIFNVDEWKKSHRPENTEPIIDTILAEMRGTLGCERIGGVGYLFGGRYVCRYLKPGKLDVGFIAHPLTVLPDELRGIEGPLSIVEARMW
jgi:dienelactone hydrolase